jgi:hypothetical protein
VKAKFSEYTRALQSPDHHQGFKATPITDIITGYTTGSTLSQNTAQQTVEPQPTNSSVKGAITKGNWRQQKI